MIIEISDSIIEQTGLDSDELLLVLAIQLFSENRLNIKLASELSGKNIVAFENELIKRNIPMHSPGDEVERKLRVIDKLDNFDVRDTIK
ncbi:MAG: UPF0175 family protein [Bacteroidia bacterium]